MQRPQVEKTLRFLPQNVPISIIKDHCKVGFLRSNEDARFGKFSSELSQRYVGPMPARKFISALSRINPLCDDKMPLDSTRLKDIFSMDANFDCGRIKDRLCEYFNTSGFCPNFKLTKPLERVNDSTLSLPELCLYLEDTLEKITRSDTEALGSAELFVQFKDSETREDPFKDLIPGANASEFNFIRDIYEELEEEDDNNTEDDEEIEDTYTRNRGEIAAYASELCARQIRTHCFSVSIYGTKVRLFRWDRAGVIISEAFDILESPEILCRFMWNYTHASAAQRGYDTSVTKASIEEETVFAEVVRKHVKEQLSIEDDQELDGFVNEHYEPGSVYKMAIHPHLSGVNESVEVDGLPYGSVSRPYPWDELWNEVSKDEHLTHGSEEPNNEPKGGASLIKSESRKYTKAQSFLVSRPVATPMKLMGRGTRGYWAVKIPDGSIGETEYRIAFIKDTWREDSEEAGIEGDVMTELVESDVKFVSDIFCHGDVREAITKTKKRAIRKCDRTTIPNSDEPFGCQHTITGDFKKAKWNRNKNAGMITPLTHYRMASVDVGYPLSSMRGTKELIHGVRCGFLAAWGAYAIRRRIHRDVSLNNLILVKKGGKWRTGILIDWELSSRTGRDGRAEDSSRAGTWAFMSIAALRGDDFRHGFRDDMESFFYVLLFASILWLPHADRDGIEKRVSKFFDEYETLNGHALGGCLKIANIGWGSFQNMWDFSNVNLRNCLERIRKIQDSWKDQPDWTPQQLHIILKSTDGEDLPLDDRIDNVRNENAERERQRALLSELIRARSIERNKPSVSESDSLQTPLSGTRTPKKRSADDAELDGCLDPSEESKRQCHHDSAVLED